MQSNVCCNSSILEYSSFERKIGQLYLITSSELNHSRTRKMGARERQCRNVSLVPILRRILLFLSLKLKSLTMTAIKLSSSPQFAVCEGINYWPVLGSPNLTLVFSNQSVCWVTIPSQKRER